MEDLRNEIRSAFEREQSAARPPAALRAQVVATVGARADDPARHRPERSTHWLMVAAAALITVAIVAGLLAIRHAALPRVGPVRPAAPPQLCVPGPESPGEKFARVHGCITYSDAAALWAVDPFHPANKISLGPADGLSPIAWSPDGRRLLLQRLNRDANTWAADLIVMDADGSRIQLTRNGKAHFGGSFSPDGTKVVYEDSFSLYVADLHGGAPRLLAAEPQGIFAGLESPAWSPDGSRIAYVADYEGASEIWTMDTNGSNRHRVIALSSCSGGGCTNGLVWSPDGAELAFSSDFRMEGGLPLDTLSWPAIYTVHPDGSQLRLIPKGSTGNVKPAWSRDGSRIAFIHLTPGTGGSVRGQLVTVARDGTDVRPITEEVILDNSVAGMAWNAGA